jgi:DNA polymerase I
MKRIDDLIQEKGWGQEVRLTLQVHDEIVYEVRDDLAAEAATEFKKIMADVLDDKETYGVPIVAESGIGKNWGEAH